MKRTVMGILVVLLALALACSLTPNNTPPNNGGLTSDEIVQTSSAATLTAMSGGVQPSDETPVPQATNTSPPNCQPTHPGAQPLDLPAGVALVSGANQEVVNFYDLQANLIGSKSLSGFVWAAYDQLHLAGGLTAGFPTLPIVYHAMVTGSEPLRLNVNNAISDLGATPQLVMVTGAQAQSFIAYTLNSSGASGWISYLYATDYSGISGAPPVMVRDESDGYVIYPLGVHTSGGTAQGIWYTASMYGIGNINFQPFKGLYYFRLSDSTVTTYVPADTTIAGFSPDQTWVAYASGMGNNPGQATGSLTLKNLITCAEVVLPFDQPTSLGGWLEFSPDNSYVAWLETFGPNPMESEWRVRVASIDGTSLINAELSSLSSLVGGAVPEYVLSPMKWVDNHVLGLSIRAAGLADAVFVIWAPDPANPLDPVLGANQSVAIGNGKLIGLLFP